VCLLSDGLENMHYSCCLCSEGGETQQDDEMGSTINNDDTK
jgi:hypothetical protein